MVGIVSPVGRQVKSDGKTLLAAGQIAPVKRVGVLSGGKPGAVILASLGEVFATSDLPAGVVNLISGDTGELYPHLAGQMEVNSVAYLGDDKKLTRELKILTIENMKRVVVSGLPKSLDSIINFTEYKTIWHPVGL